MAYTEMNTLDTDMIALIATGRFSGKVINELLELYVRARHLKDAVELVNRLEDEGIDEKTFLREIALT